jgi:hypothetical protein
MHKHRNIVVNESPLSRASAERTSAAGFLAAIAMGAALVAAPALADQKILVSVADDRAAPRASPTEPPQTSSEAQEALRLRARLSRDVRNRRRLVAT